MEQHASHLHRSNKCPATSKGSVTTHARRYMSTMHVDNRHVNFLSKRIRPASPLSAFHVALVVALLCLTTCDGTALNGVTTLSLTEVSGVAGLDATQCCIGRESNSPLYLLDRTLIRKVETSSGTVTTLAGSIGTTGSYDGVGTATGITLARGCALDETDAVLFTDGHSIRRVNTVGETATIAGHVVNAGNFDAIGTSARFSTPRGVAQCGGKAYVADSGNNRIRMIDLSTLSVSLVAGMGTTGHLDGSGPTSLFSAPIAVATQVSTASGTCSSVIYVIESGAHSVRRIAHTSGSYFVTTLAGSPSTPGLVQGHGSVARFHTPVAISVQARGSGSSSGGGEAVLVFSSGTRALQHIDASSGHVSTIVGTSTAGTAVDGGWSSAAFAGPSGMAMLAGGNMGWVVENAVGYNAVRTLMFATPQNVIHGNGPRTGANTVTILGAHYGPNDNSPSARASTTNSEQCRWLSSTSIVVKRPYALYGPHASITVAPIRATLSNVLSWESTRSPILNFPATGAVSATVWGVGLQWALFNTPHSLIGKTGCETARWLSTTTLVVKAAATSPHTCLPPVVTILTARGTLSNAAMSIDVPVPFVNVDNADYRRNTPTTGSNMVTLTGGYLTMWSPSPVVRLLFTAAEATAWRSASSLSCRSAASLMGAMDVTLTMGSNHHTSTLVAALTVDAMSAGGVGGPIPPATGATTVVMTGTALSKHHVSVAGVIGSTSGENIAWASETSLMMKAPSAFATVISTRATIYTNIATDAAAFAYDTFAMYGRLEETPERVVMRTRNLGERDPSPRMTLGAGPDNCEASLWISESAVSCVVRSGRPVANLGVALVIGGRLVQCNGQGTVSATTGMCECEGLQFGDDCSFTAFPLRPTVFVLARPGSFLIYSENIDVQGQIGQKLEGSLANHLGTDAEGITIPDGVTTAQQLQFTPYPSSVHAPIGAQALRLKIVSKVWFFQPEGVQFQSPLSLTLRYDKATLVDSGFSLEKTLSVYVLDKPNRQWVKLEDSEVNSEVGVVQVSLTHFSWYAVGQDLDPSRYQWPQWLIGLVIAAVVLFVVGGIGVFVWFYKRRRSRKARAFIDATQAERGAKDAAASTTAKDIITSGHPPLGTSVNPSPATIGASPPPTANHQVGSSGGAAGMDGDVACVDVGLASSFLKPFAGLQPTTGFSPTSDPGLSGNVVMSPQEASQIGYVVDDHSARTMSVVDVSVADVSVAGDAGVDTVVDRASGSIVNTSVAGLVPVPVRDNLIVDVEVHSPPKLDPPIIMPQLVVDVDITAEDARLGEEHGLVLENPKQVMIDLMREGVSRKSMQGWTPAMTMVPNKPDAKSPISAAAAAASVRLSAVASSSPPHRTQSVQRVSSPTTPFVPLTAGVVLHDHNEVPPPPVGIVDVMVEAPTLDEQLQEVIDEVVADDRMDANAAAPRIKASQASANATTHVLPERLGGPRVAHPSNVPLPRFAASDSNSAQETKLPALLVSGPESLSQPTTVTGHIGSTVLGATVSKKKKLSRQQRIADKVAKARFIAEVSAHRVVPSSFEVIDVPLSPASVCDEEESDEGVNLYDGGGGGGGGSERQGDVPSDMPTSDMPVSDVKKAWPLPPHQQTVNLVLLQENSFASNAAMQPARRVRQVIGADQVVDVSIDVKDLPPELQ